MENWLVFLSIAILFLILHWISLYIQWLAVGLQARWQCYRKSHQSRSFLPGVAIKRVFWSFSDIIGAPKWAAPDFRVLLAWAGELEGLAASFGAVDLYLSVPCSSVMCPCHVFFMSCQINLRFLSVNHMCVSVLCVCVSVIVYGVSSTSVVNLFMWY